MRRTFPSPHGSTRRLRHHPACHALAASARGLRRAALAGSLVLVLVACLAATGARADVPRVFLGTSHQIQLTPPRAERAPALDGRVDPDEWRTAAVLDSFTHGRPLEGIRDTLGTRCLVQYDAQNLYVAFVCSDRPGAVQAPVTGRDDIWSGDWVGMSIDSYHDRQKSLFLCANPRGIQADGVDQEGHDSDMAPDFQYSSAGRLTPEGFEVEFRIPFRTLRFPPADRVTFGFQAIRDVKRNGTHMYWAPVTRDIAGYHRQMGDLADFEGIRPGRNLELNPYMTGSRAGASDGSALRWDDARNRQGFGLKLGLTSALTADATVTPDFSQVEADAGVIDVNERFAIFFAEKRPFFQEGADLFTTPLQLVYTRRIIDPLYGVKLTGKAGRTAIAVLHAADRNAGDPIPTLPNDLNPYFDRDAFTTIARARRDVGRTGSNLGLMLSDRRQRDTWNRLAALDGGFTFWKQWSATFQAAKSFSRDRDFRGALSGLDAAQRANLDPRLLGRVGRESEGGAFTGDVSRNTRALGLSMDYTDLSRDFDARTGFLQRTGVATLGQHARPHWFSKERSWWQQMDLRVDAGQTWERGAGGYYGRLLDANVRPEFEIDFPNNTWVGAAVNRLFTRFEGREYDPRVRAAIFAGSERFRTVRGGVVLVTGSEIVFEENVPGRLLECELWSNVRLTDQLSASLNLDAVRIRRREPTLSKYAEVVIPRVRLGWQLNREMALRWIAEAVDQRKFDTADRQASHSRELSLDWLASYQLRPGTVVYLGYGTRLEGEAGAKLRATSGNVFVKASYLWQL